jgi:hypothetical protein
MPDNTSQAVELEQLFTPKARQIIADKLKLAVADAGFKKPDGEALSDQDVLSVLTEAAKNGDEAEALLDIIITRLNRSPMTNIVMALGVYISHFDGLWSDFKDLREKCGRTPHKL